MAPKNQISNRNNPLGRKVAQAIKKSSLLSLQLQSENLASLKGINSIIFIGSSFTGKSTLVDAIRKAVKEDSELASYISVPKRVVTRPQRENDNLDENDFVSPEEFDQMLQNGKIEVHWIRKMEGARTERYGFLPPKPGIIPVYSANNAMNNKESVKPVDILDTSLIVTVYAPEKVRKMRLLKRSPDLMKEKPAEVNYRLSDKAANMLPYAHLIVRNFGGYMKRTKRDVVELMKLVIKNVN